MREKVLCCVFACVALANAIRVPASWDDDLRIRPAQKSGLSDGFKKYKAGDEKKSYDPKYRRFLQQQQHLRNNPEQLNEFTDEPNPVGIHESNEQFRKDELTRYHRPEDSEEEPKQLQPAQSEDYVEEARENLHYNVPEETTNHKSREQHHIDDEEEEEERNHKFNTQKNEPARDEDDEQSNPPKKVYDIHKTDANWKNLGFDFGTKAQFSFNPFQETREPHQEVFAKIEQIGEKLNAREKKEEFPGFQFQKQTVWAPENVEHNLRFTNNKQTGNSKLKHNKYEEAREEKHSRATEENAEGTGEDSSVKHADDNPHIEAQGIENDETEEHHSFINEEEKPRENIKALDETESEDENNEEETTHDEEEPEEEHSGEDAFPKIHEVTIPTKPIYPGEGIWALPGTKHRPYIKKPEQSSEIKEAQDENVNFFPEGRSFFEAQSKDFDAQSEQFPADFAAFQNQHNLVVKPKLVAAKPTQKPNFFDGFQVEDVFLNGKLEQEVDKYRYRPVLTGDETQSQSGHQPQNVKTDTANNYRATVQKPKLQAESTAHNASDDDDDDDEEEDLFVPSKLYTQVRKYESEEHVPESVLEPRLREVVKDSTIHTVYSEEGYEDTGYDHAGHEKNAENNEGYAEVNPNGTKLAVREQPVEFRDEDADSEGSAREDVVHEETPVKFGGDYTRTAVYKTTEKKSNETDPVEHAVTTNMKIKLSPESKPEVSYEKQIDGSKSAIGDLIMSDVQKHFQEGIKRRKRSTKPDTFEQINKASAGINSDKTATNLNKPDGSINSNIHKGFTNDFPKLDFDTSFLKLTKYEEAVEEKEERYPYYKTPEKMLNKNSALRYAQDMKTIPLKVEGEMSFYKNADRKECEEVPDSVNPIPKRIEEASDEGVEEGDDKEVKGPRLEKLGDKIDCFKVKYFGEDPLDSPFFGEGDVDQPEPIFGELATNGNTETSRVIGAEVEKLKRFGADKVVNRSYKKLDSDNKESNVNVQKSTTFDSDNSETQVRAQESKQNNVKDVLVDFEAAAGENATVALTNTSNNQYSSPVKAAAEMIDDKSTEQDSYLKAAHELKADSSNIKLPNLGIVTVNPEDINGHATFSTADYEYGNGEDENAEASSRIARKLNFTTSPERANATDLDYEYEYVDEPEQEEVVSTLQESDGNSTETPKSEALKIRVVKYRKRPYKIAYMASRRNNRFMPNSNINLSLNLDPPPMPKGNEFVRKKLKRKRVKPLSEVFYKDEIKPDEQLNVLTDVINNIKNSTLLEMDSRKPVKFPTDGFRGNEIDDIRTAFYQTSTIRPLRRKPQKPMVFEPSESESMSNFNYKKGPVYKTNNQVVKVMTKNHNGGKVMVHMNPNQHQAIPVRLKVNHPAQIDKVQEYDQVPHQSVNTVNTLNTYYVAGMKPPLPEKPYLYSDYRLKGSNVRRMMHTGKRNHLGEISSSARSKRSPQRPGYAVISRQGMGGEADYKQEEDEEDDYVPHRPMNFHYDPETKKIVYHNKPTTAAPEYIEVEEEYEEVEVTTHPPKKATQAPKTVFHKDVLNPENGPTLVDFLSKLRADPSYEAIPDPEPAKEKVTTTTSKPVPAGATTPPEFLKYLEMLHKSDGYKKIEDETDKPKKVVTTTTETVVVEEEAEEEETPLENVQNSPGGQFNAGNPLQLFDISEYLPKTKNYNTRTSIDYSKYKTIERPSVRPKQEEEDEEEDDDDISIRRRKVQGMAVDESSNTRKGVEQNESNRRRGDSSNTSKGVESNRRDSQENSTTRRRRPEAAEEADLGNNRRNYSEEQESKSSELSRKTVDSNENDKYTTIKRNRIRPIEVEDEEEEPEAVAPTSTTTEKVVTTTTTRSRKRKRPTTLRPTTEENAISSESTEDSVKVYTPATHKPANRVYPRRQRPKIRLRTTTPSLQNDEDEEAVRKTRRTLRKQNETATKIPPNHKEVYTEITPEDHAMMKSDPEIIETQKQPRLVTPDILNFNRTDSIGEPGKINPRNSRKLDVEVFKEFDTSKRHGGNYIRANDKRRRRLRTTSTTTSTTTTTQKPEEEEESNVEKEEVKILFDTDVKEGEEEDSSSKKKIVIIKDPSKRLYFYAPLK